MEPLDRKSDADNYTDNPKCLFHISAGLSAMQRAVETARPGLDHVDLLRELGFDSLTPEFFDRVRETLIGEGFDYDAFIVQFFKDTERYDRKLRARLRGLGPPP